MREMHSDPLSHPSLGLSTNFPIVPVKEIPASGSFVDTEAYRPVVLVVDDEAAAADARVENLKRSGYAAMAAYDGEGALETALLVPPELVIADVELPGMSGVELANTLRSKLPDCRFLLLSGRESTPDLPAPASRNGHEFEVVSKPISPGDLFARVSAFFEPQGAAPAA